MMGCTMGVPNEVTAITFVALGTSLPDTFASKTAAVQDEYADASIGNVTGSEVPSATKVMAVMASGTSMVHPRSAAMSPMIAVTPPMKTKATKKQTQSSA